MIAHQAAGWALASPAEGKDDDAANVAEKEEGNGRKRKRGGDGGGKSKRKRGENATLGDVNFEQSARRSMELIAACMVDVYRNLFTENRSERCGTTAGGAGRDAAYVPPPTVEKFVRYINKSSNRVMLNLYLNKFELSTPAVAFMLTINYDDSNPPNRYRYNEITDSRVQTFVQHALEQVQSYVRTACSRDCLNYLFSTVVPERRKVQYENDHDLIDETAAAADTARARTAAAFCANEDDTLMHGGDDYARRQRRTAVNAAMLSEVKNAGVARREKCFDRRFVCQTTDQRVAPLADAVRRAMSARITRRGSPACRDIDQLG